MRQVVVPIALVALAGCGGGTAPAPQPTATRTAAPTPTPTVTPSATAGRFGTAQPSITRGTPQERAARRTLVRWYEAVRDRDGERACALMTPAARAFYTDNFKPAGKTCGGFFGPGGSQLFATAARFNAGAAKAARVAVTPSGRVAVAEVLDERQALRRVGGRWRIDEPG